MNCRKTFTEDEVFALLDEIPLCPDCSGLIKPDIVLFGEQLPREAFLEAKSLSEEADLMIHLKKIAFFCS